MAQTVPVGHVPDPALVHHFIRVIGRRPTAAELADLDRLSASRGPRALSARVRRGLAQAILRW